MGNGVARAHAARTHARTPRLARGHSTHPCVCGKTESSQVKSIHKQQTTILDLT